MNWAEYAAASRELSEVCRAEAGRRTGITQRTSTGLAAAEDLRNRLSAQREYLSGVATRLHEPAPRFDESLRAGLTDVDEAVRLGWQAVDRADAEARGAEQRALAPALLPGMSTNGRNVVVYLATTLLSALVSFGMWELNPNTRAGHIPWSLLPWSLCGLPAVAFFAGYLTIAALGRSRIHKSEKGDRSVRLGGVICLIGLWLVWALLVAATPH